MKKFLLCLPILAMIVFELIMGISLLNDPVDFTQKAIVIFGVFMIVLAVLGLVRWMKARGTSSFAALILAGVILDLLIGLFCVIRSDLVLALFPAFAVFYGIVMVVMGIYKISNYFSVRTVGFHCPFIVLLSGILTVILGVLVFLYPFSAIIALWQYIAIVLIVEACVDLFALIFGLIVL